MIIDFHVHTYPDRIAGRAAAKLGAAAGIEPSTDATLAGLAASMCLAGIDISVNLPVATSAHQVRSINDRMVLLHQEQLERLRNQERQARPEQSAQEGRFREQGQERSEGHEQQSEQQAPGEQPYWCEAGRGLQERSVEQDWPQQPWQPGQPARLQQQDQPWQSARPQQNQPERPLRPQQQNQPGQPARSQQQNQSWQSARPQQNQPERPLRPQQQNQPGQPARLQQPPQQVGHDQDRTSGSTILCFGSMHPDYEDYKAELHRLKAAGIPGIKLHPAYQGVELNDLRFKRIISVASELGLLVLTHAGIDIGLYDHNYASVPQILEIIREVQPSGLVLAHMGGWAGWDEAGQYLAGAPVWMDTAFTIGPLSAHHSVPPGPYSTVTMSDEDFMRIARLHGTQRILFATDCPWQDQVRYVQRFNSLPLTAREREDIFYANAARLLGLNSK